MQPHPILRCAVLALALGSAACGGVEPPAQALPEVPRYAVGDFLDTTDYGGAGFSADGSRILVTSNRSGTFDAYAVPLAGGEPVALTDTGESAVALAYFPADDRFLYSVDEGGNELRHVLVAETDGGVRDLTPGEGHRARFLGFAADGARFLIATNERDRRRYEVYAYDAATYERRRIFDNPSGFAVSTAAPDLGRLALSEVIDNANRDIHLVDVGSGESQLLTPNDVDAIHHPLTFSPDGGSLYYLSDAGSDFRYLVRHDLISGERRVVLRPEWDVVSATFSPRGRYLAVGINRDSRHQLSLHDAATLRQLPLDLPAGAITDVTFSGDESLLAYYASDGRAPRDLFVTSLAEGGPAAPRRLTRSLSPRIQEDHLVAGEVVRFTASDGLEIPGVLYSPHRRDRPLPALIWVHGGPGGQSRIAYRPLFQLLVNHGYVVFAINHRGSTGYGKTFSHLDDRDHGGGDLQDCVDAKRLLASTGYVDPARIGILGESYGGFMVLAALTSHRQAFAAGVDLFGVSNWLRTLRSLPPRFAARRRELEKEMGDFNDEAYLRSISPLFRADRIVRPLMVVQGANDPRVLRAESDDVVAAARANGVPVEYLVFEDEGHGLFKKANRERAYEAILRFLDRHLTAGGSELDPESP